MDDIWYVFNCVLNAEMLPMVLMAWGSLFHSVGAGTMKLRNPDHLFGLDEEIDKAIAQCEITPPNQRGQI